MAGDVDGLAMVPKTPGEAAALDVLLVQRNRNWLPAIERMLADNQENLIVVGAGHLAGEDDLLDLLVDAGYSVIMVDHRLRVVAACDWVFVIGAGAGVAGGKVVA